jgi:Sulfotransferase family
MLPNFLVIGAMKAGTTSLYRYLRAHPQVFMPESKELNFFVAERRWHRGRDWYEAQFAGTGDAVAVGEASPIYAMYPEFAGVPDRIARLLPQARLIYVVRHPIERMRSHYLHQVARGREHGPIGHALTADPRYLDTSRYSMQIDRYLAHLPPERLRVITAEELRDDRVATIGRVLRFLGLDPGLLPATLDREFHRTAEKRKRRLLADAVLRVPGARALRRFTPVEVRRLGSRRVSTERVVIPPALEARLRDELRDDVRRLRPHLGPAFGGWGIG